MHTIIKIAVVSVLTLFAIVGVVSISKAEENSPNWFVENLQSGWSKSNFVEIKASKSPMILKKKINKEIQIELIKNMIRDNKVAIISHKGEIIAEQWKSSEQIKPGGNSITKSIISVAIGKAVCEGKINLDTKAWNYSPLLADTSWGESTVEELLKMSSGAHKTMTLFAGHKDEENRKNAIKIIKKEDTVSNATAFLSGDERYKESGSEFIYSNSDSIALGYVLEGATNKSFNKYFQSIWQDAGAEHTAHMMVNSINEPYYHAGFAASPYDYIRFANYILKRMKKNDCFGNYLKKATTKQIENPDSFDNRNYGYHIWTNCLMAEEAFCFVGAMGQFLLFYPEKEILIYVHSVGKKWGGINKWGFLTLNISQKL